MNVYRPWWFSEDHLLICTARTCGLTKGGRPLLKVDADTGKRVQVPDPETGEDMEALDDEILEDMLALRAGGTTDTLLRVPRELVSLRRAVPVYYDHRPLDRFRSAMSKPRFNGFHGVSLGELVQAGLLEVRGGHGSPSHEQRVGDVPYIKVSDLRAGLVNINPTNRVPRKVAQRFWRGEVSGLQAYDVVCPERTSKNIGDFCVLMPGQEQVVMTREVIILRPTADAQFDPFYLLWALTLRIVRDQWNRIVFMQTNHEDVGKRYLEIEIPMTADADRGRAASAPFREYYESLAAARQRLLEYLHASRAHHFFVAGAEEASAGPADP